MSRQQWSAAVLAGLAAAAAGFAWVRTQPEVAVVPTEFPNLWRWTVTGVPAPAGRPVELRLVVRTLAVPIADRLPPHPTDPLPSGAGLDRVIEADVLTDGPPPDGRLTLQVYDLRDMGLPPGVEAPLRVRFGLRSQGAPHDGTARLEGVALRGRPVVHPAGWDRGERPLLTVGAVDDDFHYTHTFVLTVAPYRPADQR